MTRGRRQLIALLQQTRAQFVAARCGVHKSQVSRWAAGEQAPSDNAKKSLSVNYGIPVDAWADRPASARVNGRERTR